MAKIPTGNFGYRTPQGGDTSPTASFDPSVGDAINRVGQVAVNAGQNALATVGRQREIDRIEGKQAEERVQQANTALAHVNIQNGLADSFDELQRNVLDGKTDKIAATAAWEETSRKVIEQQVAGLPADRAALVVAQGKGMEGKLRNSLFDTFRKRDDQDTLAGIGKAEEGLQRVASRDLNGAIAQHGMLIDGSPLAPDVKAVRKQKFVESATFNAYRGAAQEAMQTGSIAALDEVAKRAGTDDRLDPARANQLSQTIFGFKTSIEAKNAAAAVRKDREAEKQLNAATSTLNAGREIVMNGGALSPDYIARMVSESQGTGIEKGVTALLEAQKSVAGFANLPKTQRDAVLADARAARADPTKGADPQSERQLKAAETIQANLTRGYETDPWQTALKTGVVKAAPVINVATANDAVALMQQRMQNIGDVDLAAGFKVSPLQPAEIDQLGKLVKTLKPDQAASALAQIGAVVADPDRIAQVAKQLGDKDGGALSMAMLFANAKTTEGRYTAELVLEGEQKIRDKVVKVDGMAESGWRAQIAKQVRGAYANAEVESTIIEAAFKIAAAKGGDIDNAVNLASGGIIERNGVKVPLPYGVKQPEFEKRISAITPATLADQAPGGNVIVGAAKVPLADFVKTLPDARLVHAGQGQYNVRAGNNLVTNEQGRRITLKVGP